MKLTEEQLRASLNFELHKNSQDKLTKYESVGGAREAGVMDAYGNDLLPEVKRLLDEMQGIVAQGAPINAVINTALNSETLPTEQEEIERLYKRAKQW